MTRWRVLASHFYSFPCKDGGYNAPQDSDCHFGTEDAKGNVS